MAQFNSLAEADLPAWHAFESTLGFALPPDYARFIESHNGADFRGALFTIPGLGVEEALNVLYGISDNRSLDLRFHRMELKDELRQNDLAVGNDTGGNVIVLSEDGVYYYDHQHAYERISGRGNAYAIADSFSEFLHALKAPPTRDEILRRFGRDRG